MMAWLGSMLALGLGVVVLVACLVWEAWHSRPRWMVLVKARKPQ